MRFARPHPGQDHPSVRLPAAGIPATEARPTLAVTEVPTPDGTSSARREFVDHGKVLLTVDSRRLTPPQVPGSSAATLSEVMPTDVNRSERVVPAIGI